MKENEEEKKYKVWKAKIDVLWDVKTKHTKELKGVEETIHALKTNPQYRALHRKDYLPRMEKEKKELDLISEALELYRKKIHNEE